MKTEDIVRHDICPRLETWTTRYELPRIPLHEALSLSLRSGLLAGDPAQAYTQFIAYASNPGLDIEGRNVYDVAMHHAAMLEVIATYLLGDEGAWTQADAVDDFQPLSFLMLDGRLRRVVLCSTWNTIREQEERNSWWSVADMAATGRPMLVNVIVIGQSREGFRISPWTMGYEHPENRTIRIKRKEGKFSPTWKRVRREQTSSRSSDWLTYMQRDGAFEDVVFSFAVDLSAENRDEAKQEMIRLSEEIDEKRDTMRRSACFRNVPCVMASVCHHPKGMKPAQAGWREKVLPILDSGVVLA